VFFNNEAAFLPATAGGTLALEDFENFDFAGSPTSITTLPSGFNLSSSNGSFNDRNNISSCVLTTK
jgi:hypothetical protein